MKKFPFRIIVIVPALILGLLLWKYGVNLPVQDEWETPGLAMTQFHLNQLSWNDLIVQHNESRKVFPKLFFLYLSRFTGWNTRYGMLASFLLACLISFNIYHLSKITLNSTWSKRVSYLALANLLIFSPMQIDNWMMGLQMITFVPIASITSALAIIFSSSKLLIKILCSAILCTVATFSFSNGIISWLIILPSLIFITRNNKKSLALAVFSWLFFFALTFTIYFHNFKKPSHLPSVFDSLSQPINSIFYFLSFLGSSLGVGDLISSQILGFCILSLVFFSGLYILKIKCNQQLLSQAFPWLSIIVYSLGSGVLTTAGRVTLGIDLALSPRYITFSTYAIVGTIYLLAIISEYPKTRILIQRIITVSMVCVLLLYPANFVLGVNRIKANYLGKQYSKACLNLIYAVKDEECFKLYLFPDPKFIVARALELNSLGLLKPPLNLGKTMQDISAPRSFEQLVYGQFDVLTSEANNTYTASGWSILPQYRSAAHAVILAYQTRENLDIPFAIIFPQIERLDVITKKGVSGYKNSGWSKNFSQDLIPEDAIAVSAWSYDSNIARAYKLEVVHLLN